MVLNVKNFFVKKNLLYLLYIRVMVTYSVFLMSSYVQNLVRDYGGREVSYLFIYI